MIIILSDPLKCSRKLVIILHRHHPAATKQVHERLIGGRKIPNKEKILSLYDADIEVIVRGKSGAEVEFGNKRWVLARLERATAEDEIEEKIPEAA